MKPQIIIPVIVAILFFAYTQSSWFQAPQPQKIAVAAMQKSPNFGELLRQRTRGELSRLCPLCAEPGEDFGLVLIGGYSETGECEIGCFDGVHEFVCLGCRIRFLGMIGE